MAMRSRASTSFALFDAGQCVGRAVPRDMDQAAVMPAMYGSVFRGLTASTHGSGRRP
jgi:hypothetical protein